MRDLSLYFPLLWTTLATIVAIAIGYAIGFFAVGWFLALLLVMFIVNYLQWDSEQVTVALIWYGCLLFSYLATLPWGVVVLLTGIAFGGYLSAYTIRDIFDNNTLVVVQYILGRLVNRLGGTASA